MRLKLSNADFEFNLPSEYKNVLVKVSGGLDSAICLYLLCKYVREENSNINVFVLTHNDWKKPYQAKFATKVVEWMKQHFPDVNIVEHIKKQLDHGVDYIEGQSSQKISVLHDLYLQGSKIDVTISGQNLAPPLEIQQTFISKGGNVIGGPNPEDNRNEFQDPWKLEWQMYRPIINLDKQQVAELYNMFELDELFNLTRSCENSDPEVTNNFTTHCENNCWWCYERKWGFGKL